MNKKLQLIVSVGVVLVFVVGIAIISNSKKVNKATAVNLDNFAKCISDSGAKFYGAFWCSHCQAQKKEFGSAEKYLPYVECSTKDAKSQTQICKDKKVEAYPTWIFSDGTKKIGEMSLADLATKTQCKLPN